MNTAINPLTVKLVNVNENPPTKYVIVFILNYNTKHIIYYSIAVPINYVI